MSEFPVGRRNLSSVRDCVDYFGRGHERYTRVSTYSTIGKIFEIEEKTVFDNYNVANESYLRKLI